MALAVAALKRHEVGR
ncbi:MAG: hypothetical protein ACLS3M_02185 [Collinsella sp.]